MERILRASLESLDPAALIQYRLFPDMRPLTFQVQVACDMAKGCLREQSPFGVCLIREGRELIPTAKAFQLLTLLRGLGVRLADWPLFVAVAAWQLVLTLDGGTCELLKFKTGAPFVGIE